MDDPNFERDRFEGQMNPSERETIYRLVLKEKPDVVCEVGTCRGGGSTYFIAKALSTNGKGLLYTCENNNEFYYYARTLYSGNPDFVNLKKYVNFNFGDSYDVYSKILNNNFKINICLLDGGTDSIKMVYDFTMFRPYIPIGGLLIMHDWDNGKTDYIKPILNNDSDWKQELIVIGLAVYKRVEDVHGKNT